MAEFFFSISSLEVHPWLLVFDQNLTGCLMRQVKQQFLLLALLHYGHAFHFLQFLTSFLLVSLVLGWI